MKANTVTKFAMGIALSIAVAFGPTTMVNAQETAPAAAKAAPAAAKAATKKVVVANPCLKLDEAACTAAGKDKCKWLPTRTVAGKERKPGCFVVRPNPCKGLDEAACSTVANNRCGWATNVVNKKGKPRKPFCRRMPVKK